MASDSFVGEGLTPSPYKEALAAVGVLTRYNLELKAQIASITVDNVQTLNTQLVATEQRAERAEAELNQVLERETRVRAENVALRRLCNEAGVEAARFWMAEAGRVGIERDLALDERDTLLKQIAAIRETFHGSPK